MVEISFSFAPVEFAKKKKNEKKEKKLLGDPTPTGKVLSRKRRGADKALGTRYIVVFANE